MNIQITNGYLVKNQLYSGNLDFDATSFEAILMRQGFTFTPSRHRYLKNINATTASLTDVVISSTSKTIRSNAANFVTSGFVVGNYISASGTDAAAHANGLYQLTNVATHTLTVTLVDGDDLVSNHVSNEVTEDLTLTLHSDDQHEGHGAKSYPAPASDGWTADTFLTTSNGIGFTVSGNSLYLDSFDISSFGTSPAAGTTPGAIIYDNNAGNGYLVVCYIKFQPWTISF